MPRKPTNAELQAEVDRLKAYEFLATCRHNPRKCAPVVDTATIEAKGWGKVHVTVSYFGRFTFGGGVVEIVAQPLKDDGTPGDSAALVEVFTYSAMTDLVPVTQSERAMTYTAPWGWLIRRCLTDGVRLANEAADKAEATEAGVMS